MSIIKKYRVTTEEIGIEIGRLYMTIIGKIITKKPIKKRQKGKIK